MPGTKLIQESKETKEKLSSFIYEGIVCYVWTEFAEGLVPFHRLHCPVSGENHFYTVDQRELNQAVSIYGYLYEGETCYIQSKPAKSLTPLYRMYDKTGNDHIFTASGLDRTQYLSSPRYRDEVIAGYVTSSASTGSVPLYGAYDPEEQNHFYTADFTEIIRKRSLKRDTFCILPWKHLEVRREGHMDFCCKFRHALADDRGVPLSISEYTLDEVWNCDELRDVRKKMCNGERVTGCDLCYEREDAGFESDRLRATIGWQRGWLNEEKATIDSFKKAAVNDEFRSISPAYVELRMGNACNLMCRMCYGDTSSRIAADPVHSKWGGDRGAFKGDRWWINSEIMAKIFQHPENIRQIYLLGGEPFLIKQSKEILQSLINHGVADRVELEITTNGTINNITWLQLINSFAKASIHISVDAYGTLNEYIRYPMKWNALIDTIAQFKIAVPNAKLSVIATLQIYNILNIVELFRFCDSIEVPLNYVCVIDHPHELRTSVAPPAARRLAACRLRNYADGDCSAQNRETVLSLAAGLESYGDFLDYDLLSKFVEFSQELDRTRNQDIGEACPELWQYVVETGVTQKGR